MKKNLKQLQKQRRHIPALNPAQLQVAMEKLQTVNLPPDAKRTLQEMMQAAANPASESVDVIISTLPTNRRQRIKLTTATLQQNRQTVMSRAAKSLRDMPAAEWDRLVEEANSDRG